MPDAASPLSPDVADPAARGRGKSPGFVLPIRWVVSVASVILMTMVALSVEVVAERNARRALTAELVGRLCVQASNVALASSPALLASFPELTLHPFLLSMREREKALRIATVCDRYGRILGDADPRHMGLRFVPPSRLTRRGGLESVPGVEVFESPTLLLASAPILHPNGARLGTAYVALGSNTIDEAVVEARQPVLAVFGALLAVGVLGVFILTATLLKPIDVLRAGLERIGRGDLEARLSIDSRTELGLLAETVNRMAADLRQGQTQALERERLAHEIELARNIQRMLLPAERIVEGEFIIVGRLRSAGEVGGDFYDVFRLPGGRIGFAIADVAGKGLAGCVVTSMVAALLVALRENSAGPADLLGQLDQSLSKRLERGVFVTMFVGFIDPSSGAMTYASAGHHPALLVHPDGSSEWLKGYGVPIGADRRRGVGATLTEERVPLAPGDLVIQTTDGIHETERGPQNEAFGFDRMALTSRQAAPRGAQAVIEALWEAVESWRGHGTPADDETVVVLSWEGPRLSADPFDSPLSSVAEARARGSALTLPPTLEALVRLDQWLSQLPTVGDLPDRDRARALLVLNELCGNIVEHGTTQSTRQPITVWWVPSPGSPSSPAAALAAGRFVILDQGVPFRADNMTSPDLADPGVRRRGRGFGIDLVRRVAKRLVYHPGTPIGNVTVVSIGPTALNHVEEQVA